MSVVRSLSFDDAIEAALEAAMLRDDRVIVIGEDVHLLRANLRVRFGSDRVRPTPISESAFLGAGVGAAMAGLRPVVEIMLVDFIGVCLDALLNEAAKFDAFSGGRWPVPLVVRCACGGGYGDGGQHEQCLWGMLAGIPGLSVVVPSTPADAAGLLLGALEHEGPTVFLEHKLLSALWLEYMGGASRDSVDFDVPDAGVQGAVPDPILPLPIGRAVTRRRGTDLAIVTVGLGVHRALAAAERLATDGIESTVLDLRSVAPLDRAAIAECGADTGRVLAVDEDYVRGGLSGEIAAVLGEAGIGARFDRVCTQETIPYARHLEDAVLPSVEAIVGAGSALAQR